MGTPNSDKQRMDKIREQGQQRGRTAEEQREVESHFYHLRQNDDDCMTK
jgi:hypothetical protein